jgi:hypothetical protein
MCFNQTPLMAEQVIKCCLIHCPLGEISARSPKLRVRRNERNRFWPDGIQTGGKVVEAVTMFEELEFLSHKLSIHLTSPDNLLFGVRGGRAERAIGRLS